MHKLQAKLLTCNALSMLLLLVLYKLVLPFKGACTQAAHEWLLSCVAAHVDFQMGSLRKCTRAAAALVRFFACVRPNMLL